MLEILDILHLDSKYESMHGNIWVAEPLNLKFKCTSLSERMQALCTVMYVYITLCKLMYVYIILRYILLYVKYCMHILLYNSTEAVLVMS